MSLLVIILSVFVILSFVLGVAFLFGGYSSLPDSAKLAPLEEFQKAQADLKLANTEKEQLRQQANTLAVQLDEMKGKFSWAEENIKKLEATSKDAAEVQLRFAQLEKDLNFLSQKADGQAVEAIEVITRLAAESESLQNTLAQKQDTVKTDELNNLTDENQKLKIQIDGYASKLKEFELIAQSAQETTGMLAAAEDELKKVRLQNEEQIVAANSALVKLNSDMQLLSQEISQKDEAIRKFTQELLISRQETSQQTLNLAQVQDLQKQLEQFQHVNQHLRDKEKLLTLKLVQARAQALSFEKICEEFKYQVEVR